MKKQGPNTSQTYGTVCVWKTRAKVPDTKKTFVETGWKSAKIREGDFFTEWKYVIVESLVLRNKTENRKLNKELCYHQNGNGIALLGLLVSFNNPVFHIRTHAFWMESGPESGQGKIKNKMQISAADPDPVPCCPWIPDPGWVKIKIPDPG